MTAQVVSLINLKGGVAKTTTTVQLAECLASEFSQRVLVIDLDPQTNATIALIGEDKWDKLDRDNKTIFHLFNDKLEGTNHFDINKAIQNKASNLRLSNLSLLASSIRFIDIQDRIAEIAVKTHHSIAPMEVLKSAIAHKLDSYDYILIDCPPNLGYITQNGIEISDYFLIPTIPDRLSIYGLPQIIKNIHKFSERRSLKIRCLGLVITKYSSSSGLHAKVMKGELAERYQQSFADLHIDSAPIFQTTIPQANTTAEAMEYEKGPKTFREKYGYSKSGDLPLYKYVVNLAKEFIEYVNDG